VETRQYAAPHDTLALSLEVSHLLLSFITLHYVMLYMPLFCTAVLSGSGTSLGDGSSTQQQQQQQQQHYQYGHEPGRTLLEFAIEAVCDAVDHTSEAQFAAVLHFLAVAVQRGQGKLPFSSLKVSTTIAAAITYSIC
jgi:hypothetical protein